MTCVLATEPTVPPSHLPTPTLSLYICRAWQGIRIFGPDAACRFLDDSCLSIIRVVWFASVLRSCHKGRCRYTSAPCVHSINLGDQCGQGLERLSHIHLLNWNCGAHDRPTTDNVPDVIDDVSIERCLSFPVRQDLTHIIGRNACGILFMPLHPSIGHLVKEGSGRKLDMIV